jgi:hypothetical protein
MHHCLPRGCPALPALGFFGGGRLSFTPAKGVLRPAHRPKLAPARCHAEVVCKNGVRQDIARLRKGCRAADLSLCARFDAAGRRGRARDLNRRLTRGGGCARAASGIRAAAPVSKWTLNGLSADERRIRTQIDTQPAGHSLDRLSDTQISRVADQGGGWLLHNIIQNKPGWNQ